MTESISMPPPNSGGEAQPSIADALVKLSMFMATVPEPWRSELLKRHSVLSDSILAHLATMMERDRVILGLVDQTKCDTQYIAFDLEATRRERDALQGRVNNILGLPEDDPELQE